MRKWLQMKPPTTKASSHMPPPSYRPSSPLTFFTTRTLTLHIMRPTRTTWHKVPAAAALCSLTQTLTQGQARARISAMPSAHSVPSHSFDAV
jgi:hypothetical protein